MDLAAADHDTVFQSFLDVDIGVGIGLFRGPQHPVALHIRLGATTDEVFRLEMCQPLLEIFMVLRGPIVHLVHFVGDVIYLISRQIYNDEKYIYLE